MFANIWLVYSFQKIPPLATQRIPITIPNIGDVYGKMMNVDWKCETLRRTISKENVKRWDAPFQKKMWNAETHHFKSVR